jgi:hypothetical protein
MRVYLGSALVAALTPALQRTHSLTGATVMRKRGTCHMLSTGSELYGNRSLELIPLILLLASCCIDIGNLKKAETCLTQASFIVSKCGPDCPSETKVCGSSTSSTPLHVGRLSLI